MKASHFTKTVTSLSLTAALAVLSTGAYAFSDDQARRAIIELREQVKLNTESTQRAQLQLADQIDQLRQEVAELRGQLERVRWAADLDKALEADRLGMDLTVDNPREQRAYESALNAFRQGKYPEAASGFGAFLEEYPNSQLGAEALFYQGSSLYAVKRFDQVIAQLQSLVEKHPDNARAPDALLIVSASQVELDKLNDAKTSLQKIVSNYPDSSAAQTAKARLELL